GVGRAHRDRADAGETLERTTAPHAPYSLAGRSRAIVWPDAAPPRIARRQQGRRRGAAGIRPTGQPGMAGCRSVRRAADRTVLPGPVWTGPALIRGPASGG